LTQPPPLFEARRLSKRFGGVQALDDVSLSLEAGVIVGLIGENGAGKSTLIKCWAGAHRPDGGAMAVNGRAMRFQGPADAEASGLRFIHQELQLVPYFDAVENCFLGRRYPRKNGLIDWAAMRRRIRDLAEELAPDLPLDVPVHRLSAGHRQFVEILRALLTEGKLLVLDEPTTALSEPEVGRLFGALRAIRARGTAVVYISHRLEEVLSLTDRIAVMRDGRLVDQVATDQVSAGDLVALMSGDLHRSHRPTVRPAGEPLLRVEGLRVGESGPGVSFQVGRGEIVGLYGLLGSGRSETLQALFGAAPAAAGHVTFDGAPYRPRSPHQAIRQGVALVPEDRRRQALVLRHSVRRNLTLPHLDRFRRLPYLPWISGAKEQSFVMRVAKALSLKFSRDSQAARFLSGGNQQKLVVGRWLAQTPRLFLFDEPTQGVDVRSKAEIHDEIRSAADRGAAVLVASSDLDELRDVAHRILALRNGSVVASFDCAAASRSRVLEACYGG